MSSVLLYRKWSCLWADDIQFARRVHVGLQWRYKRKYIIDTKNIRSIGPFIFFFGLLFVLLFAPAVLCCHFLNSIMQPAVQVIFRNKLRASLESHRPANFVWAHRAPLNSRLLGSPVWPIIQSKGQVTQSKDILTGGPPPHLQPL